MGKPGWGMVREGVDGFEFLFNNGREKYKYIG